jgi:hypothetical protein
MRDGASRAPNLLSGRGVDVLAAHAVPELPEPIKVPKRGEGRDERGGFGVVMHATIGVNLSTHQTPPSHVAMRLSSAVRLHRKTTEHRV